MNPKPWHLDVQYDENLFSNNWPTDSSSLLLNLFRHLDKSNGPVLSMLPPEVSPAGAAVAASLFFLPGTKKEPHPHCRIALYPGMHFVNQLKEINFEGKYLWAASTKARVLMRGEPRVSGPLEKLGKSLDENKVVNFHWIFKCKRVWDEYGIKMGIELTPRGYYGRKDQYEPSIELILTDRLDSFSDERNPYDLLIYCPSFHSTTLGQTDDEIEVLIKKVVGFKATRKLIVVRSPYDYWAKTLEYKLRLRGIALSSKAIASGSNNDVSFTVVDQLIGLEDSFLLFRELNRISKNKDANQESLSELKSILRRLLAGLDPKEIDGDYKFDELPNKLESLINQIGLPASSEARKVIEKINVTIRSKENINSKIDKIREISGNKKIEVWATKESDKQVIEEYKERNDVDVSVRLANRWITPGARDSDRIVLLSRIDREADLNLVAYLRPGDLIVMSAWEAVIRGVSIMSSWEKSEKWREYANELGIMSDEKDVRFADPVLDLASFLEKSLSVYKNNGLATSSDLPPEDANNWWDENSASAILNTNLERAQLIVRSGDDLYRCKEIRFKNSLGMFVREDDEFQVIHDEDESSEILATPVLRLKAGMIVLLFKDSERSTIFEILMDQLERSSDHQVDARAVRDWKSKLKAHVNSRGLKIQQVVSMLSEAGRKFDNVTIRSWIYGSTMAPQHYENFVLLIKTLKMEGVYAKSTFESVKRLRSIGVTLGRALNQIILHKDLDKIEDKVRSALLEAGIDIEELFEVVEPISIENVLDDVFEIEAKNIRKLFKA